MINSANIVEWILGLFLILSSLGVILFKKPVYCALSFLGSLLVLSSLYLQLSASFVAVMQILVYAGAILVIFMFVIVLFQDAHEQIDKLKANTPKPLLIFAGTAFTLALVFLAVRLLGLVTSDRALPEGYGTVQSLGNSLFLNFFFPFEAVILLFLLSVVGAVYIAKKDR